MRVPGLRGDGDGWISCGQGHRHWGTHGAAGLLLRHDGHLLLQHRAPWTHNGDTWGLPGGAATSTEDAVAAALRECSEEVGLHPGDVVVDETFLDDHGGWGYTTVLATASHRLDLAPTNAESVALAWVAFDHVESLTLHPGFARTWPTLRLR